MSNYSIPAIPPLLLDGRSTGADLRRLLALMEATSGHSPEERRLQQAAHLKGLLQIAAQAIPNQRTRLPDWCKRGDFTWERFFDLPLCRRSDLMRDEAAWHHPSPPPAFAPGEKTSTSGSTGTPLITWGHRAAGMMKSVQQIRMQRRLGFDFDATCAFLTSPHPPGVADPPHGRKGGRWARAVGTGEGISLTLKASSEEQLSWLLANEPKYLATYPSNLLALLQVSEELGRTPSSISQVVLSSEPVTDELVEWTRKLWKADCTRTYSASETGLLASQVPGKNEYYVEAENALLEILRDDGTPCEVGEVGRVVVTTLQDFLRPLIRYEIGDYAEWAPPDESDPITLPRLRRIAGRERTMIRLSNGHRVWPHFEFAPLMAVGGLRSWQLVQRRDDSLQVRVVTEGELTDRLREVISEVVQEALPGLVPTIHSVDRIERTPGGKFLEVVRED